VARVVSFVVVLALTLLAASTAFAHFGMMIPDRNVLDQNHRKVELTLSFSHPFEGHGMDLVKPKAFGVFTDGKIASLLDSLKPVKVMDHEAFEAVYQAKRPGVYQFYMEPQAYWEPAEDTYIIHYTKTFVAAFGADEGWDTPIGLPTEIVPLTRPFGNYEGDVFQGQVLVKGKPAPGAEVEVEFYNKDGEHKAPSDSHVTQVVKADANGVFTFACPQEGWWGFAALSEADYKIKEKSVELGAVLWVKMDDWED
jgi:cobalt/nickel transport protein